VDEPTIATTRTHGRTHVIGRGRFRGRKLTLKLQHLNRGRYSFTLLGRIGRKWVEIGHTSIVGS
jgi:hypothetical protein